jgi:hypothetical protein
MDIRLEEAVTMAISRTVIGSVTTGAGSASVTTGTGYSITAAGTGNVTIGPGDGSVITGHGDVAGTDKERENVNKMR